MSKWPWIVGAAVGGAVILRGRRKETIAKRKRQPDFTSVEGLTIEPTTWTAIPYVGDEDEPPEMTDLGNKTVEVNVKSGQNESVGIHIATLGDVPVQFYIQGCVASWPRFGPRTPWGDNAARYGGFVYRVDGQYEDFEIRHELFDIPGCPSDKQAPKDWSGWSGRYVGEVRPYRTRLEQVGTGRELWLYVDIGGVRSQLVPGMGYQNVPVISHQRRFRVWARGRQTRP